MDLKTVPTNEGLNKYRSHQNNILQNWTDFKEKEINLYGWTYKKKNWLALLCLMFVTSHKLEELCLNIEIAYSFVFIRIPSYIGMKTISLVIDKLQRDATISQIENFSPKVQIFRLWFIPRHATPETLLTRLAILRFQMHDGNLNNFSRSIARKYSFYGVEKLVVSGFGNASVPDGTNNHFQ